MSIQREFPSYDDMKGFADLLDKLPGFVDSSWHNDTCPSMEHEQSQTRIWVEYADPDNRENAGPRFSIEQGDLLVECVFSTDDAALVVEWVKKSRQLTPEKCGASQLACNIVNNTFLSLDGFAAMRKQMEGTTYTAQHFGAELARIVDRNLQIAGRAIRPLFDASDETELYHAFNNRGSSNTKRKVAAFLRELDRSNGRTTREDQWYAGPATPQE